MTVAWESFTPWSALAGGAMIGVAAAMLILVNGRIAGISGIVAGLLKPRAADTAWRVAFVLGLIAAPTVVGWIATLPDPEIIARYPVVLVAGMLVGLGTRYGGGCTSGHGVCGVSRLSPRSLVATLVFMGTGFAVVYAVRHLLGH